MPAPTLSATDRSGIARIDVLLVGSVVATASGSGSYSAPLSLDGIANGVHALVLRAVDSLGNTTSSSYSITVAHAVPTSAPALNQPQNGLTTRTAAQTVVGTAQAGSSVQLLLNGQAAGAPLTAGSDGRFSGMVALVSGTNRIQATASDSYGTSAASACVQVNLDITSRPARVPLTAAAQAAGKVTLTWDRPTPNTTGYDIYRAPSTFNAISEAVKINGSPLNVSTFDDLPPQTVAGPAASSPSTPPVRHRSRPTQPKLSLTRRRRPCPLSPPRWARSMVPPVASVKAGSTSC